MIIAGVDTSYSTTTKFSVACVVYIDTTTPELNVVYTDYCVYEQDMEYKCGFLGERECPVYIDLIIKAPYKPDVILVDGNGILHPERYGSACRLGDFLKIKTIGVAKTLLEGLTIQTQKSMKNEKDNLVYLKTPKQEILGAAYRNNSKNYIYISIGHSVTLEESIEITKSVCIYKIPEPIRRADILSREYIRKYL